MLNNFDSTRTRALRHSGNHNLHLHYADTFEGLPVMIDKGPFICEHLSKLKRTIQLSLDHYPRGLAFRVDLRLPCDVDLPSYAYTNEVISRFIDSLKAKIKHSRNKAREYNPCARDTEVRYVWAREVGREGRQHYHLLVLLNRDAFFTVGRLGTERRSLIVRMEEAWRVALGLSVDQIGGLVHIPRNAEYRIDRNARFGGADLLPKLFYRASYLCKSSTKSFGVRQRSFGSSMF